jgi:hypothetical protein
MTTHHCFLLSILLDLQLAVAVAAQDDGVVGLNSKLLTPCWTLLPLQVLPPLCPWNRFENDGDIVLTCKHYMRCWHVRHASKLLTVETLI